MSRVVPKEQKKFDTNSKPMSEMIWKGILYLENMWRINRYAKSTKVMILQAGINIACLVSQLTMTRIVLNLEDDRSFSMKSIEIEFYSHLGIGSCLRNL